MKWSLRRISSALTLLRTVWYLKPVQILGRLYFSCYRPRVSLARTPARRPRGQGWLYFPPHSLRMLGPRTLRFLNETRELSFPESWNDPGTDKLWLYNLHYFEDLVAESAPERAEWHRDLIGAWIADNPPFEGNGWEPYPISLRIGCWIKWVLAGNELDEAWQRSLALQAEYLSHRVEWHLLGNHVFENARALVLAGSYFQGSTADTWLEKGLCILDQQLDEQILGDGGHFERSPMYHALVLEGILDLVQITEHFEVAGSHRARWREYAGRMLAWLRAMTHPDGDISFFNDAAFDIALSPGVLEEYAGRLGVAGPETATEEGVTLLEESGYIRAVRGPWLALLDAAPVGPAHQPGHAHADTLSFELSVFGQRVLVNSGTSVYGVSEERLRQRETAAHNTVTVDGQGSSEVWSGFRVARRARPFDVRIRGTGDMWQVAASHDGYSRLPGRVTHRRTWSVNDAQLIVEDELSGVFDVATAKFHFDPRVSVELEGGEGRIVLETGEIVRFAITHGTGSLVYSTYHPEFGVSRPNQCLELAPAGGKSALCIECPVK